MSRVNTSWFLTYIEDNEIVIVLRKFLVLAISKFKVLKNTRHRSSLLKYVVHFEKIVENMKRAKNCPTRTDLIIGASVNTKVLEFCLNLCFEMLVSRYEARKENILIISIQNVSPSSNSPND